MSNKRVIIGGILLLMLLLFLFKQTTVIEVSYQDGSFYLKEDSFEVGWIHSVENEPWFETFELRDDGLYLVTTRFKTFGAGTPSTGKVIPSTDGYVHMEINQKMESISLVVSENVRTTLRTSSSTYLLYQLVEDYETVTIGVKKIPLWVNQR